MLFHLLGDADRRMSIVLRRPKRNGTAETVPTVPDLNLN